MTLAPVFPTLLALRATMVGLRERVDDVVERLSSGAPKVALAQHLEAMREMRGEVDLGEAVEKGLGHEDSTEFSELNRQSLGLVVGREPVQVLVSPYSGMTTLVKERVSLSEYFLLAHYSALRARGAALRDEAAPLVAALQRGVSTGAAGQEQRRARLMLGRAALEWRGDRPPKREEAKAQLWVVEAVRKTSPEWGVVNEAAVLGMEVFCRLAGVDRACDAQKMKSRHMRRDANPLLDSQRSAEWRGALDGVVEKGHAEVIAGLAGEVKYLPMLMQGAVDTGMAKTVVTALGMASDVVKVLSEQARASKLRPVPGRILHVMQIAILYVVQSGSMPGGVPLPEEGVKLTGFKRGNGKVLQRGLVFLELKYFSDPVKGAKALGFDAGGLARRAADSLGEVALLLSAALAFYDLCRLVAGGGKRPEDIGDWAAILVDVGNVTSFASHAGARVVQRLAKARGLQLTGLATNLSRVATGAMYFALALDAVIAYYRASRAFEQGDSVGGLRQSVKGTAMLAVIVVGLWMANTAAAVVVLGFAAMVLVSEWVFEGGGGGGRAGLPRSSDRRGTDLGFRTGWWGFWGRCGRECSACCRGRGSRDGDDPPSRGEPAVLHD